MSKKNDIFAEIATTVYKKRSTELKEQTLPELPEVCLPTKNNPSAEFLPPHEYTIKEYWQDLQRLAVKYEKFLKDCAHELKSCRKRLDINEFSWRQQASSDLINFSGVLNGDGEWKRVKIPHYGPPVGRAVTYYRQVFELSNEWIGSSRLFICFRGVDYKAAVFVNDFMVGTHEGLFAPFEFDVTPHVQAGQNILLVQVENDSIFMGQEDPNGIYTEGDKLYAATGCGWDEPGHGWHHCPPGMGIYQAVYLERRPAVHIKDIFIRPLLNEQKAEITIEVNNCELAQQRISFIIDLFGQNFKKKVVNGLVYNPQSLYIQGMGDIIKDNDRASVAMDAGPGINYYKLLLDIPNPRAWSPAEPWLYQIQVSLRREDGTVVDTGKQQFGMRNFRMESQENPKGRFFLNDRPVKLRGMNTMGHLQQCVMKNDMQQLRQDILIAKLCNLNFIRLTQCPVQKEIYEYCDKLGMMIQTDLPLFGCLRRNKFCDALTQVAEMECLVRNHACNVLISYINEPLPNGMSKPHRNLTHTELEAFYKAADIVVHQMNPDRVIKAVDGDYDPPSPSLPDNHCYCGWYVSSGIDLGKLHKGYWLPVKKDWNYACGEFGAEGLDPVDLMKKRYPGHWLPRTKQEEHNWSPDQIPFAQTGKFHYMWFDTQHNLAGWVEKSQKHQAWIIKLMAEAFRRDNRFSSHALHLLIDAFPAGWMKAVVDCERRPKPAYFEYRKAMSPLMVHIRTDRYTYFSGEEIELEAWSCSDLCKEVRATLFYQVELGGDVILANKKEVLVHSMQSDFHGFLRIKAPAVGNRCNAICRIKLVNKNQEVLGYNHVNITLIPAVEKKKCSVQILMQKKGICYKLVKNMGLKSSAFEGGKPNTLLIDDLALFKRHEKQIAEYISNGGIAVVFDLPVGHHNILGSKIAVDTCGMGPRHFVSRQTAHQIVEGFEPDDFKFWYDAEVGYVSPFIKSSFRAKEFQEILSIGNGSWQGNWVPAIAVGEMPCGKGYLRICQIELHNRVKYNPIARIFANRLLKLF